MTRFKEKLCFRDSRSLLVIDPTLGGSGRVLRVLDILLAGFVVLLV